MPDLAFARYPLAIALALCLVSSSTWAGDSDAVFAFDTGREATIAFDAEGNRLYGYQLTPKGRAHTDRVGRMRVGGGAFLAEGIEDGLDAAFNETPGWTLVAAIEPDGKTTESETILALRGLGSLPELILVQHGTSLAVEGKSGLEPVCKIESGGPTHVVLVVSGSRAACYVNGALAKEIELDPAIDGGEIPTPLAFGSGSFERAGWRGSIEHVSLYARTLSADEVARDAKAFARKLSGRRTVPPLRIRATLVAKSDPITVQALAPYTRSLTVFAYDVTEAIVGDPPSNPIYVAHWTILDAQRLPFADVSTGGTYELTLEPYGLNPQIESENLSDLIVEDYSLPLFYDAGGLSLGLDDAGTVD